MEKDQITQPETTDPEVEKDELEAALDAALEGDENVDLRALVFELFESFGSAIETEDESSAQPLVIPVEPVGSDAAEMVENTETEESAGCNEDAESNEADESNEAVETGEESVNAETGKADSKKKRRSRRSKRSIWKQMLIFNSLAFLVLVIGVMIARPPENIKGLKAIGSTYSSALITWEGSDNAEGYRIYRSEDGKKFDYIDITDQTSYSDNTVRTGTTYYYAVTAKNGIKSSKIDRKKAVEITPHLEKPELTVNTDEGKVDLTYTPVSGAIGYQILRNGKKIGTSTELKFTDEKAKGDTDYTYEVKAYRYKKDPVYSGASNAVETKLETVGELIIETAGDGLHFDWEPAEVYTSFKIYDGDKLIDTVYESSYNMDSFELDKTYDISIIGYTEDESKRSPKEEKKFEIAEEPMDNAGALEAACEWGVNIASDNSFTYGTGMRAHRYGCYFCGTNVGPTMSKKGKSTVNGHSYAKTYCCNPFVHACFAHGAGDQNMLSACRKGRGIGMSPGSFTRYGNWKNVGMPAYSDLRRGDVIVSHSHVMLYIGDGQIVNAGREGWDADSIAVENMSPKYYRSYDFVMRYTGTGSGTMYVVKEIGEDGKPISEDSSEDSNE